MVNIENHQCVFCLLDQEVEMLDADNIASFDCKACGRYAASLRAISEFQRSDALKASALEFVRTIQSPTHMAEFVFEFELDTQIERLVRRVIPRTKYH